MASLSPEPSSRDASPGALTRLVKLSDATVQPVRRVVHRVAEVIAVSPQGLSPDLTVSGVVRRAIDEASESVTLIAWRATCRRFRASGSFDF